MGYNISGLVIDKNYENNIEQLEKILGEKLTFEKEVEFEKGSENWKEDNYCDIYFSDKGTLIFISMERGAFEFNIKNQKSFSFALSEMTMTFAVNYTDNEKMIRSFVETEDGERPQNIGDKLTFEETENDASELIHHLIESTLGKSYWDIELEEKCKRFKFNVAKSEPKNSESITKRESESEIAALNEKPWWKFW
ncbi:hypothetical protein [Tenacibaculum finnmarkense]|uniref:hypothetical protein n=1 Tax=Tenacibaculum finnmarkense TaxID=2781243 RepID=UPI001EFB1BB9|nr:hypothetical protein [Tenacibaculum finnmarkense]MCG8860074.1 hypothetical protein [Tenacibaculum finnmarkense]